jgi:hypothetical protein
MRGASLRPAVAALPLARVFTRVSPNTRLYSPCLVLPGFLAWCRRRAASRYRIQSCTSHRRDTFFCSVAGNGSAIVDEIFEAAGGLSSARFFCALRDKRPSAVAGESLETSGRRACVSRSASEFDTRGAGLSDSSRARARPSGLSHGAQPADGSTEFLVNSSNRFSAPAEVALPGGHTQPLPREARFPFQTAEQSFVLSTRPAVGLPRPKYISSLMRARRFGCGVASCLRGT